jgi:hypothetical protein
MTGLSRRRASRSRQLSGERGEVVGPGCGLAEGAPPVCVVPDRGDAVVVGFGDHADRLSGGVFGHDQLGPVFSVPSRMAWQAASRMSQSRLPMKVYHSHLRMTRTRDGWAISSLDRI